MSHSSSEESDHTEHTDQTEQTARALITHMSVIRELGRTKIFFLHGGDLFVYVEGVEGAPARKSRRQDRAFHIYVADLLNKEFPNTYDARVENAYDFKNSNAGVKIRFVGPPNHQCQIADPVPLSFAVRCSELPFSTDKERLLFAITTAGERKTLQEKYASSKGLSYKTVDTKKPEPVFGAILAALVANVLDVTEIPYVFWGWPALSLIEVKRGFPELEFVIPDRFMHLAREALQAAKFPVCLDKHCSELSTDRGEDDAPIPIDNNDDWMDAEFPENQFHPVGAVHFHLKSYVRCRSYTCGHNLDKSFRTQVVTLHLLRQSDILPWMNELKTGAPAANDSGLTLSTSDNSSDLPKKDKYPRGPTGPWARLHSIKILKRGYYMESVFRLLCRDLDHNEDLVNRWLAVIQNIDGGSECVRPRFRAAWGCIKDETRCIPYQGALSARRNDPSW
ncbi:hypothetical protein BDW62DRAFT_206989 [Aspergillus aurantiobrunneus]